MNFPFKIPSFEGLEERLKMYLEQYNESIRGAGMDLVFFRDAMIHLMRVSQRQEPITRSLHLGCTLESTLSNEELFLEQALPRKSVVSEDVNVNEHD